MNKKNAKKITSMIVTIGVIIFFVYYFIKNPEVLLSIKNISFGHIVLIITVQIIILLFYAFLNHIIIKKIQKDIPLKDNVFLQFANNFLNKVFPKAGIAFRSLYLKEVYKFPYSKFISTLSGVYVISFISYSIASFVVFYLIYIQKGVYNYYLIIAFIGIFLLSLLFIFLPTNFFAKKEGKVFKILDSIMQGWSIIKKDLFFVLLLTVVTIVVLIFNTFQMQIIYRALGLEISYLSVLFLSIISLLTLFINITPEAIGIKEGIYAYSADIISIPSNFLVLGSLVDRGISIVISVIFGGASYLWLLKKYNMLDRNKIVENKKIENKG